MQRHVPWRNVLAWKRGPLPKATRHRAPPAVSVAPVREKVATAAGHGLQDVRCRQRQTDPGVASAPICYREIAFSSGAHRVRLPSPELTHPPQGRRESRHVSSRFCVDVRRSVFVSGVRPYEELYIELFEFICGSANTRRQRMTICNCAGSNVIPQFGLPGRSTLADFIDISWRAPYIVPVPTLIRYVKIWRNCFFCRVSASVYRCHLRLLAVPGSLMSRMPLAGASRWTICRCTPRPCPYCISWEAVNDTKRCRQYSHCG